MLHNIGNLRYQEAAWAEATALQQQYLELSRLIGNRLAEAHGPRMLGSIRGMAGDFEAAALQFEAARAASEASGWTLLTGWTRAAAAQIALLEGGRSRAPAIVARAAAELASSEEAWRNCDDAGEYYASLSIAQHLLGDSAGAAETVSAARAHVDPSWLASVRWLELADGIVRGEPHGAALAWFEGTGMKFVRRFIDAILVAPPSDSPA